MAGCCGKTTMLIKVSAFLFLLGLVLLILGYATPLWSFRPGENEGLWEKCIGSTCWSSVSDPVGAEGWFITTQVLVTFALVAAVAGVIVAFIVMFDPRCAENKTLRIVALANAFGAGGLLVAGGVLYWIRGDIFFGIFNLGFSWGIIVSAAVVFTIVGILIAIDIDRLHNGTESKPEP